MIEEISKTEASSIFQAMLRFMLTQTFYHTLCSGKKEDQSTRKQTWKTYNPGTPLFRLSVIHYFGFLFTWSIQSLIYNQGHKCLRKPLEIAGKTLVRGSPLPPKGNVPCTAVSAFMEHCNWGERGFCLTIFVLDCTSWLVYLLGFQLLALTPSVLWET